MFFPCNIYFILSSKHNLNSVIYIYIYVVLCSIYFEVLKLKDKNTCPVVSMDSETVRAHYRDIFSHIN